MAPQMLSAPGTFNVQCPWHYQCSVSLALSQCSLHSFLFQLKWILEPPLSIGCQSISGWNCNFHLFYGIPLILHIPLEMEWIMARQVTVSPNSNWAESYSTDCYSTDGDCDSIAHCLMLACQLHCECCTFASVLSWKEIISFMTSAVGHQPANMC